jgi:hypothetical protein
VLDDDLFTIHDLNYAGAFRVSAGRFRRSDSDAPNNQVTVNYAEGPIAYNSVRNSLYIVGHTYGNRIAEFKVPEIINSTTLSDLQVANEVYQNFETVLGKVDNPQKVTRIRGMEYVPTDSGAELIVNAIEYYDAPGDNTHTTVVARDADNLAESEVDGFFTLPGVARASGWISPVPDSWQSVLGSTHIVGGSSGWPIISRHSVGPSAYLFDPMQLVGTDKTTGTLQTEQLLGYSLSNKIANADLKGGYEGAVWTNLSGATYGFIIPDTNTYMAVGFSGGHESGIGYKTKGVVATVRMIKMTDTPIIGCSTWMIC